MAEDTHQPGPSRRNDPPEAARSAAPAGNLPVPPSLTRPGSSQVAPWLHYVLSVFLVVAVTLVAEAFRPYFDPSSNLVVFYLAPVVISALYWGAGPSVVTSILSILIFRALFVPRVLPSSRVDDYFVFLTVVIVGLVVSTLATRAHEHAAAAEAGAGRNAMLYALSRDLAGASDESAVVAAIIARLTDTLSCNAAVMLPQADALQVHAASPGFTLEPQAQALAVETFRQAQRLRRQAHALQDGRNRFLPLVTANRTVGVLVVSSCTPLTDAQDTLETPQLLDAFASQAAIALERAALAEEAEQAYLHRETEKLQTAMLNSISHDLRTPLASITGALTSLMDRDVTLDEETRLDLLNTAYQEASRLNHLVGNLLDTTRLESGAIHPLVALGDIQDLVGAALTQLGERLKGHPVTVDVPDAIPPVPMDFALLTQVLVNLLDNALKYSPAGSPISVQGVATNTTVIITVADRGPGIPAEAHSRIFDRFFRLQQTGPVAGAGLGLSISKGIVDLHNGRIAAANRAGGGAIFTVELPLERSPKKAEVGP